MTKLKKNSSARVLKSRLAFRGPLFQVTVDDVREPGGFRVRRDVVRHPGSVVVLAVRPGKHGPELLLERQYRYAAGAFLWELPAGKVDHGERELAAAKRELLEETGYRARRWRPILNFYVSPGFLNERMRVFLAQQLSSGLAQPEEDELIECRFVPLRVALQMINAQQIRDAKTLAGIYWLAFARRRLRGTGKTTS